MKLLAILLVAVFISGCSVSTSSNIKVDGNDLVYFKDNRTDMCFAAVASKKAGSTDTTGLGITQIECTDRVLNLIE